MAVAFDAISALQSTNNNQNPSWTHTPVGTPTAAVVFIWETRPGTIVSVTYGGAAMSLLATAATDVVAYGLANPAAGAQTVQVNGSSTQFRPNSFSLTFTGTHLTTASCFTDVQTDTGTSATAVDTLTITSQTDDLVVNFACAELALTDLVMNEGADQTERGEGYGGNQETNLAVSTQPGAASVAMDYSWTGGTASPWHHIAFNIVQAAAGGSILLFVSKDMASPVDMQDMRG